MTSIQTTRRGFTLIELLVVIAIIAILAAILFPVFAKARAKARQASDASNQKQAALGFLQYLQDYDEKFPPVATLSPAPAGATGAAAQIITSWGPDYPVGTTLPGVVVPGLLSPYIKSNQLFQDPSGPRPGGTVSATAGNTINDYFYNDLLAAKSQAALAGVASTVLTINGAGQDPRAAFGANGATVSQINTRNTHSAGHSATTDDNATDGLAAIDTTNGNPINQGARDQVNATSLTRHSDGANVSYADGHVKWSKIVVNTDATNTTNKGVYFPALLNTSSSAAAGTAPTTGAIRGVPCTPANTEPVPGGDMCGFSGTFHLN